MPYSSLADLPQRVRGHVPPHAQKIFLNVWNSIYEKTGDEERAFKGAWSKVHNNYGNPGNKMWKKRRPFKYEEEGKHNSEEKSEMDDWDMVKAVIGRGQGARLVGRGRPDFVSAWHEASQAAKYEDKRAVHGVDSNRIDDALFRHANLSDKFRALKGHPQHDKLARMHANLAKHAAGLRGHAEYGGKVGRADVGLFSRKLNAFEAVMGGKHKSEAEEPTLAKSRHHTNYGNTPRSTATRAIGAHLSRDTYGDKFGTTRESHFPVKGDKFEHLPSRTSYQVHKVERSGLTVTRVHYKPVGASADTPLKSMSGNKWSKLHSQGNIHHWAAGISPVVDNRSSEYGTARSQNRRGIKIRPASSAILPENRKSEDMDDWDIVKARAIPKGAQDLWGRKSQAKKKAPRRGSVTVRPTEFEFKLPFFKKDSYREELKRIPGSQFAGDDDTITIPMSGENMARVAKLLHDADFYLVDWTELARDKAVQKTRGLQGWGDVPMKHKGSETPGAKKGRGEPEQIEAAKSVEEQLESLTKSENHKHKRKHHPHGSLPCAHCAGLGYYYAGHSADDDDDKKEAAAPVTDPDTAPNPPDEIARSEPEQPTLVKSGRSCRFCGLDETATTFANLPGSGYCDNCLVMNGRAASR